MFEKKGKRRVTDQNERYEIPRSSCAKRDQAQAVPFFFGGGLFQNSPLQERRGRLHRRRAQFLKAVFSGHLFDIWGENELTKDTFFLWTSIFRVCELSNLQPEIFLSRLDAAFWIQLLPISFGPGQLVIVCTALQLTWIPNYLLVVEEFTYEQGSALVCFAIERGWSSGPHA